MIELFIAFGAGLISFLSPCVLPLIPGYMSFISGQSLNDLIEKKKVDLLPLFFTVNWCLIILSSGRWAKGIGSKLTSSVLIPDLSAPLALNEIKEKNMVKK